MKQILKTGILAAVLLSGCVYRYSEGDMQEGISIQVFNRARAMHFRNAVISSDTQVRSLWTEYVVTFVYNGRYQVM
ncbi:hypothetical protein ACQSED_22715 [Salmonella enterica]|uniref:hypothetical protein n=1 Tax=Salmonella enterica TaxID=28901 RepID=UPI00330D0216|nr:hypothetical protein [Salmonella enterica]